MDAPATDLILIELQQTLSAVDPAQSVAAIARILAACRIFTAGAGRSGLALRMAAMRLMHLGLAVHVVGEPTTPAIAAGDLLLVASASGTTSTAVHAAEVARKAGAEVLLLTTASESRLAELATAMVLIPAATRQQQSSASQQYAGTLFEQSVLLLTDALFQSMWTQSGQTADQLSARHANLE